MFTEEEVKNLEVTFTIARSAMVTNKEQLVALLNFEKAIMDKIEQMKPKEEDKQPPSV